MGLFSYFFISEIIICREIGIIRNWEERKQRDRQSQTERGKETFSSLIKWSEKSSIDKKWIKFVIKRTIIPLENSWEFGNASGQSDQKRRPLPFSRWVFWEFDFSLRNSWDCLFIHRVRISKNKANRISNTSSCSVRTQENKDCLQPYAGGTKNHSPIGAR